MKEKRNWMSHAYKCTVSRLCTGISLDIQIKGIELSHISTLTLTVKKLIFDKVAKKIQSIKHILFNK